MIQGGHDNRADVVSSPHGCQFKSAPVIQGGHDKCARVMSDRNESFGSVMQIREELADAIIAGNAKQARAVMVRHVTGFQASLTA